MSIVPKSVRNEIWLPSGCPQKGWFQKVLYSTQVETWSNPKFTLSNWVKNRTVQCGTDINSDFVLHDKRYCKCFSHTMKCQRVQTGSGNDANRKNGVVSKVFAFDLNWLHSIQGECSKKSMISIRDVSVFKTLIQLVLACWRKYILDHWIIQLKVEFHVIVPLSLSFSFCHSIHSTFLFISGSKSGPRERSPSLKNLVVGEPQLGAAVQVSPDRSAMPGPRHR